MEEMPCSSSSRATKQLIISQCPKILCIHLLRASVSLDGEPIKHQDLITCHFLANVDVSSSSSSSPHPSMSKLYGLSAVVEHYGKCGGGHYAVYRRVASNPDPDDPGKPLAGLGRRWFYISDGNVSEVPEEDVLCAEATLLFYERL
ncbi:unnamed protein product [Miscanthus lutarioriparius]|uniref:USP domain-containing protein n=1 Tax=Miscanthus lutarioriparius TaxID=422564 RepID=A0A811R2N8_9POAL|nr:unnamed protein product [Miscanthus lutarioriparius]